jgi:hypothetical protein
MHNLYALAGQAAEKGSRRPDGKLTTVEDFKLLQDSAQEHDALVGKLKIALEQNKNLSNSGQ